MIPHPLSFALSLFFVLNPLGNIPIYMGLIGHYEPGHQRRILIREFIFALLILLLFNFFGAKIFHVLGISLPVLSMGGGILLLLIAIDMIFPKPKSTFSSLHEPLLVPLATPVIAGPGSITIVMLFSSRLAHPVLTSFIITIDILVGAAIAILASCLHKKMGERGLVAFERLGGMLTTLIAVQLFASGTVDLIHKAFNI